MNRLGKEASPYLLQHANNPVDWFPWGEEALAKSKVEDKPILLSIGYSACHWCHVMERESFENEAIAKRMNELFVNIKVDREERPDLDHIYQLVVQIMGRNGGWPLTVFLTPEQKPFFAGTYFPPDDKYGRPGFPKVLEAIAEAYRTRKDEIAVQSNEIAQAINEVSTKNIAKAAGAISASFLGECAKKLGARFDDVHGGFGSQPKFPNTMALEVLLRAGADTKDHKGDLKSLARAVNALQSMRRGGIYDQLGGGFHRYSTDAHWLVPHFEKMLYDNALLLKIYVDAFRATKKPEFAATAREVAAYTMREMQDARGGYYATQDADSEGHEGKFFVWTKAQVKDLLGDARETSIVCEHFGIGDVGNFEDTDASVLSFAKSIDELASEFSTTANEITTIVDRAKKKLFDAREKRVKPFRDEKILSSWNGLMIAAMADAGAALDAPELTRSAERALEFLENVLVEKNANGVRVQRHTLNDIVKGPGFLDDYAFVANGALTLYETLGDPKWALFARDLADSMIALFWDDAESRFYFSPNDGETLIVRPVDPFDHAIPSATSIACEVLLKLGTLTDAKYAELAKRALEQLAGDAEKNPFAFGQTICEIDRLVRGSVDVVLVGDPADERTTLLAREAHHAYLPNRTIALVFPSDPQSVKACALIAEGKWAKEAPVAYVCRGQTCSLPVEKWNELRALLDS
jgi:uncharacterized protein YyaL (SSP411 family)